MAGSPVAPPLKVVLPVAGRAKPAGGADALTRNATGAGRDESPAAVTAVVLPASPSFYSRPQSLEQAMDTVLGRVLDHLGIPHAIAKRWGEAKET